jgi:acyl carrier protein
MEEKIIDALREALDNEDIDIQLNDTFREYDDWDSLAYLTLIAVLDEQFGVEIENDDFKGLKTVGDLVNIVQERAKAQA